MKPWDAKQQGKALDGTPPACEGLPCPRCGDTGIEPGTVVISPGGGSGFNSLDPDPLDRGSYVPCKECGDRLGNGARGQS